MHDYFVPCATLLFSCFFKGSSVLNISSSNWLMYELNGSEQYIGKINYTIWCMLNRSMNETWKVNKLILKNVNPFMTWIALEFWIFNFFVNKSWHEISTENWLFSSFLVPFRLDQVDFKKVTMHLTKSTPLIKKRCMYGLESRTVANLFTAWRNGNQHRWHGCILVVMAY